MAIKLLEMLASATMSDLEAVEDRIKGLDAELSQLKAVKRVLSKRLAPTPKTPRAAPAKRATAEDGQLEAGEKRRKIAHYILVNGPKSQVKLSEVFAIAGRGNLSSLINHKWFHVAPDGLVSVTTTGEDEIRKMH